MHYGPFSGHSISPIWEFPESPPISGRAAKSAALHRKGRAAKSAPVYMINDRDLHKVVFGKNMARARRDADQMTQEELADKLKVDRRTVNRWEKGRREPRGPTRLRIAQELKQPLSYFSDETVLDDPEFA